MEQPLELPRTTERKIIRPVLTTKGKRDPVYIDLKGTYHSSWAIIFENPRYTIERLLEMLYLNAYSKCYKVYPHPRDVLSAFTLPLDQVKVVMVGQDPYPGWDKKANRPVACGKSFATLSNECPGSLMNMIVSIQTSIGDVTFTDKEHQYSLKGWTDQGVLLLNKTPVFYAPPQVGLNDNVPEPPNMTAKDLWEGMTELICRHVLEVNPTCVFVLVGSEAHKLEPKLGNCIKLGHPSSRNVKDDRSFNAAHLQRVPGINWTTL